MTTTHTTGAELQTQREALHLTRDDLATLAGVQARTVKHWESGRAGVPADVAELLNRMETAIHQASASHAEHVARMIRSAGHAPADVVLIRYRTTEDLERFQPEMKGFPAGAHAAMVQRLAEALRSSHHIRPRIVWMDAEAYTAWRHAAPDQRPDNSATRAQWAAEVALPAQAMPHRADQPPGA